MRRGQQGVALISIMLVVVMATVLAVQMTSEQHLVIQRSANRFDATQARQYAIGGEELARQILREDFEERPGLDLPTDLWASNELQFEFENGSVELLIEDMQGRFNINRLFGESLSTGGEGAGVRDDADPDVGDGGAESLLVLGRLMTSLGVDAMFTSRIRDWVDPDDGKGQLGAEDFDYLALDPPYRSADQMMYDESELRLLLEMDADTYNALAPFVSAVPDPNATLNINTASAPVLAALTETLTLEAAEGIVASRDQSGGYETVNAFLQDPALAGSGLAPAGLGVQSNFFRVSVRARFLDRFAYLTSIIQRNSTDGSMRVVYRDMSKRILPVVIDDASTSGEGNG